MRKFQCLTGMIFLNALSLCLPNGQIVAQSKRVTLETKAGIQWAGVDRPGDLFLVLTTGEIQKFDKTGKKLGSHSFDRAPTLFDPMDGVQCFYYMATENQYGNISSDLSTATRHVLDPAFAISPWLVCPSLHELWILDASDFTIKKTTQGSATISLEAALIHQGSKKIQDYLYMREYQNYVFLLDKNAGVHLFNSLGKFIKTLGESGMDAFNFLGEELYYVKGNELLVLDLYTEEKRKLTLPQPCRMALVTDDTLFAIEQNRVVIYDFKP